MTLYRRSDDGTPACMACIGTMPSPHPFEPGNSAPGGAEDLRTMNNEAECCGYCGKRLLPRHDFLIVKASRRPRAVHMLGWDGEDLCITAARWNGENSRFTRDASRVTCKRCLRLMAASAVDAASRLLITN